MPDRVSLSPVLCDAAKCGDQEAWVSIYYLVRPFIVGLSRQSGVTSTNTVDDVCQDVLMQFFRSFPFIENYGAWLYVVIKRCIGKHSARHPAESSGPHRSEVHASSLDESLSVWEALRQLSIECQKLLCMIYIEQYSHAEVADNLRMPKGSVHRTKRECVDEFSIRYMGGEHV